MLKHRWDAPDYTRPRSTCTTLRLVRGSNLRLVSLPRYTRTNLLTSRYIWGFIDYMMLWQYYLVTRHTPHHKPYRNTRLHSSNYNRLTLHNVTRGISKLSSLLYSTSCSIKVFMLDRSSVRTVSTSRTMQSFLRNVKLDLTAFPNATVVSLKSLQPNNLSSFSWKFTIGNEKPN